MFNFLIKFSIYQGSISDAYNAQKWRYQVHIETGNLRKCKRRCVNNDRNVH